MYKEVRRAPPDTPWLLVLFAALLATDTDEFVIAGVLPEVAESLDVTVGVAGQLVTAFAVVYALGAPRWP
ncbi:MFS transporter [Actinopolyspora erythraea]|uniref:MFS transporter n=1 Tax=Actinopolyspora erythraea TaxID=414996 RepID=UPI0018DFBEF4|nr:MFS transporter [Actinopolyspora erythraea]